MADYHPLIARAVAGLERNTGEERRKLYERARIALVAQLRGVVPALDESEITRERLALEEAIRKVEADSARHARESARPIPRRLDIPPRGESAPRATPQEPSAPRIVQPPQQRPSEPTRPPDMPASFRLPNAPRPPAELAPPLQERRAPPHPVNIEQRADHPDFAPPPPTEPRARPSPPPPAERHPLADYGSLEPQVAGDNLWSLPPEGMPPDGESELPPGPPPTLQQEPEQSPLLPMRRGGLIGVAVLALLIAILAGLTIWQWPAVKGAATGLYALVSSSGSAQRQAPTPARPKITDRIGQPSPQTAGVAVQRVVLYEEDPDDPQGKRFTGTVNWRTEMKSVTPGRTPEMVVRADIEIPERKMSATWTLRRNTDPSLPASHTIEIVFNLPADSPTGGVAKVPGVLMKQSEQTRGLPLAGVAAEMPPAYFLIGLSSVEADVVRNIQLLKERSWFDIPIVYKNNRRAILAMEKGPPGEKAFNEAFAAWKQ